MSGNRFYPRKYGNSRHYEKSIRFLGTPVDKWKRNVRTISKTALAELYLRERKSMQEIADELNCSLHKVAYWMNKHRISCRLRSEAMYVKHNPDGDPFHFKKPKTTKEAELFGLGLGLYWGEGTKADLNSVRLGNADPRLIGKFIEFLVTAFRINKNDLRFGLQIFSDVDPLIAMDFWIKNLKIRKGQFYKTTVTRSGSIGTYRKKSQYGVLTVYYHNKKLRGLLGRLLPE